MRFMLLFQPDEPRWAGLAEAERDGLADCDRSAREMIASGQARRAAAPDPSALTTNGREFTRIGTRHRSLNPG